MSTLRALSEHSSSIACLLFSTFMVGYVLTDRDLQRVGFSRYVGVTDVTNSVTDFQFTTNVNGVETNHSYPYATQMLQVRYDPETRVSAPTIEMWWRSEQRRILVLVVYQNYGSDEPD